MRINHKLNEEQRLLDSMKNQLEEEKTKLCDEISKDNYTITDRLSSLCNRYESVAYEDSSEILPSKKRSGRPP